MYVYVEKNVNVLLKKNCFVDYKAWMVESRGKKLPVAMFYDKIFIILFFSNIE